MIFDTDFGGPRDQQKPKLGLTGGRGGGLWEPVLGRFWQSVSHAWRPAKGRGGGSTSPAASAGRGTAWFCVPLFVSCVFLDLSFKMLGSFFHDFGVPGAPIFEDFGVPGSLWRPLGRQSGFWEHLGTHFGVILGASWEPPGQFWDTVFDLFFL